MNKNQKILIFDIESSYNQGLFFDVWETNIPANNITTPSHIHCIAYKWYGEKKTHVISQCEFPRFKKDIHDDTDVLKEFKKVVEQADILVGHNINRFDIRKINARLILKGLEPTPHTETIDTLQLARRYFKFNHNSLDAVAKALGYRGKLDNPKNLWIDCFFGNIKKLNQMSKYCKNDVRINEFVFTKLLPFMNSKITKEFICGNPICKSENLQLRGMRGNKQRFQCNDCGKWGYCRI
jgi:DNA polymerase elongation subunit (family B)